MSARVRRVVVPLVSEQTSFLLKFSTLAWLVNAAPYRCPLLRTGGKRAKIYRYG